MANLESQMNLLSMLLDLCALRKPTHAHGEHANCTQNNKSYKHIGSLKVENLADIQNKMVCGNQNHPPLEGWILNHTKN